MVRVNGKCTCSTYTYYCANEEYSMKMDAKEYDKDITTLSSRGQLVIPKKLRQALKIRAGDTLGLIRIDDLLVIKKIDFGDEKVGKKVAAAKKENGFTFEELLYPEKK